MRWRKSLCCWINTSEKSYSDYNNVYEILTQIAYVSVSGSDIMVRGISSVNGSSAALIVIDNIVQPSNMLGDLATQNIKSVSVLKGLAASAYVAKGANGVVIIAIK